MPFLKLAFLSTLALTITLGAQNVQAGFVLETEGLYYSNTKKTESDGKGSEMYLGVFTGATFQKSYFIGFRFDYFSDQLDVDSSGAQTSGISWGPRVGSTFGRSKWLQLAVTYYPFLRCSLSESGQDAGTLYGSGFQGELAIIPQLSERMYVGVKLTYRKLSYSKIVSPDNASTDVSYSDTHMFPALVAGWRFE